MVMSNALKAHVENGHVVLDEPMDLPDGTPVLIEIAAANQDDMDPEERAALEQSIEEGYADYKNGDAEDAFEHLARLTAAREDQDRSSATGSGRTGT